MVGPAVSKLVALLSVLVVWMVATHIGAPIWLKGAVAGTTYLAFRVLLRPGENPHEAARKLAANASGSPAAKRTFGNVPLSQQSPGGASPSGPMTPEDERLRKRITAAERLGNSALSQQDGSKRR